MRFAAAVILLLVSASNASAYGSSQNVAEQPCPSFVGIDLSKLPEKDRKILTEAMDDFQAVTAGRKPIHASPDLQTSPPADGGTSFYIGRGYRLTIEKAFSELGSLTAVAYGPILTFNTDFAPGNENRISDVRLYSLEALDSLLKKGTSDVTDARPSR
ncbi:hypothetical protein SAMN05216570_1051 [Dyella sp. OK004]|nr:hypothetical protein SAMN05216570_1051 [Dyella sp. OK004]